MPASSACLEIHVINVGQGDSILIINRDLGKLRTNLGTAVTTATEDIDLQPKATADKPTALLGTVRKALLIDAGEDMYGESVVGYLVQQGVLTQGTVDAPDLSVLMTHYHSDHIGGLPYLFLEQTIVDVVTTKRVYNRKTKKTETKKITIKQKHQQARYRPGKLYFAEKTLQDNTIGAYNLVFEWAGKAGSKIEQIGIRAGGLAPGSPDAPQTIDLGTGASGLPITLRAVAAIAQVWNPTTKKLEKVDVNNRVDPNDRSVVLVLEYGSFRGFLGADIAGNGVDTGGNGTGPYAMDSGSKKAFSQHGDVEKVLMPIMAAAFPKTTSATANQPKFSVAGQASFYKASHHGSSSSNDIYSLGQVVPRVVVVSSGLTERFHSHPTQEVMGRLGLAAWATAAAPSTAITNTVMKASGQDCGIFITEIAARVRKTAFGVTVNNARNIGDVIVRPVDESIVAAQAAKALGNKITLQVYGSGIQTELDYDASDSALRANEPSTGTPPYKIGPFLFECNQH
jgi:beta-lactamase superfamily II metal-dependent hydrolase